MWMETGKRAQLRRDQAIDAVPCSCHVVAKETVAVISLELEFHGLMLFVSVSWRLSVVLPPIPSPISLPLFQGLAV